MKKIAVYTAIFGARDTYKEPPPGKFDSFLFTDTPTTTERAIVRRIPSMLADPVRSARMLKLLPHLFLPDYEITLWIDGSMLLMRDDVNTLVDLYLKDANLATFRHYLRDCIYEEARACVEQRKDDPYLIQQQVDGYRAERYPEHDGLVETRVLLRRSLADDVVAFDHAWWCEVRDKSRRDQLSFNYVLRKLSFRHALMEGTAYHNPYFRVYDHTT